MEVEVIHARDLPMEGEKLSEADDKHHRGILNADDEVVAYAEKYSPSKVTITALVTLFRSFKSLAILELACASLTS